MQGGPEGHTIPARRITTRNLNDIPSGRAPEIDAIRVIREDQTPDQSIQKDTQAYS